MGYRRCYDAVAATRAHHPSFNEGGMMMMMIMMAFHGSTGDSNDVPTVPY
jgi:hypothetical protein